MRMRTPPMPPFDAAQTTSVLHRAAENVIRRRVAAGLPAKEISNPQEKITKNQEKSGKKSQKIGHLFPDSEYRYL